DTVAEDVLVLHPEARGAVHGERVGLHERPVVEQQVESLARRELAALVLLGDGLLAATAARLSSTAFELLQALLRGVGHRVPSEPASRSGVRAGGRARQAAASLV